MLEDDERTGDSRRIGQCEHKDYLRDTAMTGQTAFAGAPPRKLYRVGELVRHSGLSRQTIHNYTAMGLIREAEWTPGGHRLYDEAVFYRLHRIAQLRGDMKMPRIREVLDAEQPIS